MWKEEQAPRVKKERKHKLKGKWECFHWEAYGQCSTGDSCSFSHDELVQGDLYGGQRRKRRSSSPAPNSKAKTDEGTDPPKHQATEKEALQTKGAKFHADTKIEKKRYVKFGTFLCVKTTSLRPDVNLEEHVPSDMLRLRRRPPKSQRKVVRKDQFHY